MGLRLLVVGSLEQQEGALSQPISKSSSDAAQTFSPPVASLRALVPRAQFDRDGMKL